MDHDGNLYLCPLDAGVDAVATRLDATGAVMWDLLHVEPVPVAELVHELTQLAGISDEVAAESFEAFLSALTRARLVECS